MLKTRKTLDLHSFQKMLASTIQFSNNNPHTTLQQQKVIYMPCQANTETTKLVASKPNSILNINKS